MIGIIGVAARIQLAVQQNFGRHAHWFGMKRPIEQCAEPGDRRFYDDDEPAGAQQAIGLAEKDDGKLEMVQTTRLW